ncbi:MAG: hypothetical protein Kow0062_16820 [Acidobacteriota bacterium]
MTGRGRSVATALALALALAPGAPSRAEEQLATYRARVTYVSGSSVYIDAGARSGVVVGDRVDVVRDGHVVLVLEVREVSGHRAVLVPQDGAPVGERVAIGDEVRLVARKSVTPVVAPPEPAPPAPPPPRAPRTPLRERLREAGLRGRVGLAWLAVRDRADTGGGFSQPALTVRLDGSDVGGSGLGVHLDTRVRRTYRDATDETVNRTRVYRASVEWYPAGTPWRVSVGRQFSQALAGISLFDGALAEYQRPRWGAGAFVGSEPDPATMSVSTGTRQYGAYLQARSERDPRRGWEGTAGVIGSYVGGEINREFLYLQGRYRTQRLFVSLIQEIDINRGWRAASGQSTLDPTSTFVFGRYKLSDRIVVDAGWDDRQNVRLYRDRTTPETEFDDSSRQGYWAGVNVRPFERFRVGLRFRGANGGAAGSSDSWTLTTRLERLTAARLGLRTRSTRYTNALYDGWLHVLGVDVPFGERLRVGLEAGRRDDEPVDGVGEPRSLPWYGFDIDLLVTRSIYLLLDAERSTGEGQEYDQVYLTLSWRF